MVFNTKRSNRAFTLIELLVVIAIIAILAAILFPVFANARERARQTQCLSNLKQLCIAFRRYADDNSGRYPLAGWGGLPNWCGCLGASGSGAGPIDFRRGQIWPYVKSDGAFLCPTDRGRKGRYPYTVAGAVVAYPLSYSMNTYLDNVLVDSLDCRRAGRMLLLMHEARGTPNSNSPQGINDGIFVPIENDPNAQDMPDKVHWNGSTAGYIDCHARYVSYVDLIKERDQGYWIPGH